MKYAIILVLTISLGSKPTPIPKPNIKVIYKVPKVKVIKEHVVSDLGDTFEDYQRLCDNLNK